ncbi:uncharacterized protein LOC131682579 [Topomyia yanbarensis]|uniref:uncharacterized protein LOC131682579 n=1 Tax=Topomyia yanbarensis TaxID=2498891 RepID=UPI00273CF340|nr:uncharacterized protein LOC131682579 [Topomyia yanbarensis]XP_058820148.1 uncharacterized protein LOC131682579 [Topomyia yanbarensis]
MATRRPRVKVAANLSIRRPSKSISGDSGKDVKPTITELSISSNTANATVEITEKSTDEVSSTTCDVKVVEGNVRDKPVKKSGCAEIAPSPIEDQHTFKFPKPVEETLKITTPAPLPHSSLEVCTEEPHSPKKLDSKFAYINALNSPRKRIRTESMTSNKSYSDVSLKSRKTIKQEESQKASDAKRDLRKRLNNIQNIDKQSLTMFDMIYYNPAKNPMKNPAFSKKGSLENIPSAVDKDRRSVSKSRSPTPAPMLPPLPPNPPKAQIQLTPQLKLGPNGEMILDETSLVIENEREKEIRDTMARTEIVYDDEFSGNSGYYSRYKRTRDWPPDETIRFYRCLHTIGTDFSMMIQLFPNRSRRDLKLKFKKEERLNLMLVNKALLYPKEFNIEELKQQFQQEDEEIERQREQERQMRLEAEETLRQQKTAKRLQLNQNKNRNPKKRVSKAARVMLDDERLSKAEPLMKEVKPKRRKRKTPNETNNSSAIQQPSSEIFAAVPSDAFVNPIDPTQRLDNPDQRNYQEVSYDPPYIPNEDFTVSECAKTNGPSCSEATISPSVTQAETPPLDIESMDIEIVDAESRSLYEIKSEPQVYPLGIYQNNVSELNPPNVITLQNLDDQSQTTVAYQEPMMGNVNENDIDSIESKYYGGCDMVYLPMPANAPIARPVKGELFSQNPPTVRSPPLHYDLLPLSAPDSLKNRSPGRESSQSTIVKTNVESERVPTPDVPVERLEAEEPVVSQVVDEDSTQDSKIILKEEQGHVEQRQEPVESEEQNESHGLGPLEDIDLNSLVLVESQDTTNPDRTIFEIYVIDQQTGKLSEKPLDVPEDVIENIRSILETGEDSG